MDQPASGAPAFTVSADLIRGLIDCAVQCGVPRAQLADLIGEDKNAPGSPPVRYAAGYALKFWDRVLRLSGDEIIGFRMAHFAGPKTFGALSQILPRCANVMEALRQAERYSALASDGARIWITSRANTFTVHVSVNNLGRADIQRTVTLWGLTNLCLMPQRVAGVAFSPREIVCNCASPSPADVRALREKLPITFDANETKIVFDRHVGDIPIPTADSDLQALLLETMERHLAALGPAASFEKAMLTLLRSMMNGNMPTLASLSARSGMSQRTLQRRLSESNTSFQALLKQVLRERAEELLATGGHSQGEIAFLLGYSEVSAFSRAYHSWTGHPPGAVQA